MSGRLTLLLVTLLPTTLLSAPPVDLQGDPLPEGAVARIGTVRLRHGGRVTALAFSPDGKTLASAGEDRQVSLWDIASGKELRRLSPDKTVPRLSFKGLSFIANGKELLAWEELGELRRWDVSTGKLKAAPAGWPTYVGAVSVSSDGNLIALLNAWKAGEAALRPRIQLWDIAAGKVRREIELEATTRILTLSPNGRFLATGGSSPRGFAQGNRLWDANTGKELRQLPESQHLLSFHFTKDEKTLLIADNQKCSLHDVATGEERGAAVEYGGAAEHILPAPDGKGVFSIHSVRPAVLFTEPGKKWREFVSHVTGVTAIACSPDGKTLATGGDNTIRLWDMATGKEHRPGAGPLAGQVWARFLSDGKLAIESTDRVLRFHDAKTGREVRRFPAWPQGRLLDVSPDCKLAAVSGEYRSNLSLVNLATGKEVRRIERPQEEVFMVLQAVFSPDGKRLAVVSDEGRQAGLRRWPSYFLRLWDVSTGEVVREMAKPAGFSGNTLKFSPDGQTLAMSTGSWNRSDNRLWLWNVGSGERLTAPPPEQLAFHSATFSPDSRFLAIWGDVAASDRKRLDIPELRGQLAPLKPENQAVQVWEVATGKRVLTVAEPGREPVCVSFSRSGRFLALGFPEGDLLLWDLAASKAGRRLRGHRGPIESLAFSSDGKLLVSGSQDVTAVVWDVAASLKPSSLLRQEVDAKRLTSLWADLAGDDALRAYEAVRGLAGAPESALPLLRDHLRPVPVIAAERLLRLIADLDSDRFATRNRAMEELRQLERMAEAALRHALTDRPTLDARRRIEQLLADLEKPKTTPAQLRLSRALLTLEYTETPAAHAVLRRLAEGAPGAWLTEQARTALDRWQQ